MRRSAKKILILNWEGIIEKFAVSAAPMSL